MLTKTCHRACLSANADFTDTKKTKSFKDRENGKTELKNYLKPLTDKNAQLLTCGIFYCRVSANLKGCGSLQTSSWLDSDVLRNRQQKHTAKPLAASVGDTANFEHSARNKHLKTYL